MSGKNSRYSPSPSVPSAQHTSKLPKFLQKQANRDRSASTSSLASGSSASTSPEISPTPSKSRKSSKFLPLREKEDKSQSLPEPSSNTVDEAPVIVEPVSIPRPRTRSERPLSSVTEPSNLALYSSTSSTSRIGDLPTRLSGWFSHTFSTSSTDLSLPTILSHSTSSSPKTKSSTSSALLTAAKHGKGHLMRYLLDSDATPDKCPDPIWIMGVQHPGYEPPPPPAPPPGPVSLSSSTSSWHTSNSLRSSTSSTSNLSSSELTQSPAHPTVTPTRQPNPAANWPPVFYADFTSRIWLTYRSQFTPIRDGRLADLSGDAAEIISSPTTTKSRPWGLFTGEKGWTSDAGWGCMLRTGQSLLANALVHLHLGREWRKPPYPVQTADYATYVQILTWFFDTPAPEAPFSVHRMALAGKELGKDVGQWFGPSTAAGAIKTLANNFPDAGLGVAVATDGVLFQTDVFTASHVGGGNTRSPKRHHKSMSSSWGDRPVLLLIGVRLGIDGVNPIYYDTIKLLYTFPQSVGIAGGRPSSSYYFVGSQSDNLFYLDPHHARPAIPLRLPPNNARSYREASPESDRETKPRNQRSPTPNRIPASPSSVRTGSSAFSYHAPLSPSPLHREFSTSSEAGGSSSNTHNSISPNPTSSRSPPHFPQHPRWSSESPMDARELLTGLDPLQEHYVTAYHASELKTFHCERVRKMPLSGLDPSMLIGFLCKDELDWRDFRKRIVDLPRVLFSVQDEPPTWPSDSDDNMGLESVSDDMDATMDEDDDEEEQFFDTRSMSASPSSASGGKDGRSDRSKSEDLDTEEDPVDPITPGPNSRFSIEQPSQREGKTRPSPGGLEELDSDEERYEEGDIEDDWVDPSIPSPPISPPSKLTRSVSKSQQPTATAQNDVHVSAQRSNGNTKEKEKGKGKGRSRRQGGQVPVPVPIVKIPTPSSNQQEHFPFPVTQRSMEDTSPGPQERSRNSSTKGAGKRMHTARARDGGRTQSGGVKGVLTED